jgi:hypothetical protein
MISYIPTKRRQFTLYLDFTTKRPEKIRVITKDATKANTVYSDRTIQVNGKRQIYITLPLSPEALALEVFNVAIDRKLEKDPSFEVTVKAKPLIKYDIVTDEDTRDFIDFNNWFSENAGMISATRPDGTPSIYKSANGKYTIQYFDVIKDENGSPMTTPARIGHTSGTIQVAANAFRKYTIPMRHVILDHEFSHKYRNPKLGFPIEDEIGADINALYFYLGEGFSKVDATEVYCNVFYRAQNKENLKRLQVINKFIKDFENEEYAKRSDISMF